MSRAEKTATRRRAPRDPVRTALVALYRSAAKIVLPHHWLRQELPPVWKANRDNPLLFELRPAYFKYARNREAIEALPEWPKAVATIQTDRDLGQIADK